MFITGVLCFSVDGTLNWGRRNCPGSWNERVPPSARLGMQAMSDSITSLRQAAEWGMGAITKVYRLLQLPLPFDPAARGLRLQNIFRLYNFRVRRTGISQIKSVLNV